MLYVRPAQVLMVVPRIMVLQVAWWGVIGEWLGELIPVVWVVVGVTVPKGGRGWRIASHGVTVVGAVFQGHLSIFVQFLELGPSVLEPDFHLKERQKLKMWFDSMRRIIYPLCQGYSKF